MLTFISGNKIKINLAREKLSEYNIPLKHKKLDLVEPQIDSIEHIAEFKLKQAYNKINDESFITDVGWEIPALNGFPGPYMAHVARRFSAKDWLNLMKDKDDRKITVKVCLAYTDGEIIKKFVSVSNGVFLKKVSKYDAAFQLDRVISFRKDRKSGAKCRYNGESMTNDSNKHWDKFCKWYAGNRL